MMFRKVAGPLRLDADSTTVVKYTLDPSAGGRMCKTLQYMLKIIQSSPANVQVGVSVEHGPDGNVFASLDDSIITLQAVDASSGPKVLEGHTGQDDSTTTTVVGEWILPTLSINRDTGTGPIFALVELYEMRKPF